MRFSLLVIWLLIVAMVLVDASLLTLIAGEGGLTPQWPHPLWCAIFALSFSQIGLAVIWASLGRQTAPWRLGGAVLVVVAWSVALATAQHGSRPIDLFSTYWAVLLSAQAGVILVPLLFLRATGVRLVREAVGDVPEEGPKEGSEEMEPGLRPGQFSLGYLLAWMTAVAVVLGLVQSIVFLDLLPSQSTAWIEIGIMAITASLLTFVSLWAVLGSGPLVLRAITLCTIVGVVAGLFGPLSGMLATSVLWLLQTILLTASLAAVRVAGYRLGRASGV